MYLTIFIEILFAPIKLKLSTSEYIILSAALAALGFILVLYLNHLLKSGNDLLLKRYEESNIGLAYSINSVLLEHSSFSNKMLKNYPIAVSEYVNYISGNSKSVFSFSEHFKKTFKQDQNIFYELNRASFYSLKYFSDEYANELRRALTTFKHYDLQASLMKEKLTDEKKLLESISEEINKLQYINRISETSQLNGNIIMLKNYLDKYSFLIEAAESHLLTLGSLKTDDLKFEAHLVIQQLFDTMHNYGSTIYSLLNSYYIKLNAGLTEFTGRSNEYIKYLDYYKMISEIRKEKNIETNASIGLVNILDDNGSLIAVKAYDSKAGYYILHKRNDIELYPVDYKNSMINYAFDIDKGNGTGKTNALEPALCRRLNETEFKIISKGVIKFL